MFEEDDQREETILDESAEEVEEAALDTTDDGEEDAQDQEAAEGEVGAQDTDTKYTVEYNGKEMELDVSDLTTYAQKGMNYDHVHNDLVKTRETSTKTQSQLDRLTSVLNQFGYNGSAQDIADMLEAQSRDIEPDQVRREREAGEAHEIAKQEAEAAKIEAENIRKEAIFARDLAEIQKINPNVKSLGELGDRFFKLRAAGLDNLEAYELVSHKPVTKQAPTGKDHLITLGGSKSTDSAREIPKSQLAEWRDDFPNDTPEQLKARYNRALNAGKG